MKDYIEKRATDVAKFIIKENATVRETAKKFDISKSTVHMVVSKVKVLCAKLTNHSFVFDLKKHS